MPNNTITAIQAQYRRGTLTPTKRYQRAIKKLHQTDNVIFICQPTEQPAIDDYDAHKPLSGILFSVKDTFNQVAYPTCAGSIVPTLQQTATTNATALSRLLTAGAIPFGRSNMSEFALSGLGINPHYGTPTNALDTSLIAGGSTSGGALSVALGLCEFALGTDTGGSLRIPAAFNGLVGFKPSQSCVPSEGCFPLSPSLDCIGPIAHSVEDCQNIWRVLSQSNTSSPCNNRKRLLIPNNVVMDALAPTVSTSFAQALNILQADGWTTDKCTLTVLDKIHDINRAGGLVLPEAAWVHRHLLATSEAYYDPLIAQRIKYGQTTILTDYIDRLQQRNALQHEFASSLADYDALLCPTVAITPPSIQSVNHSQNSFSYYNQLVLRNTALFNYLDTPAISLPFTLDNNFPIGLMLCGIQHHDHALLELAKSIEITLKNQ